MLCDWQSRLRDADCLHVVMMTAMFIHSLFFSLSLFFSPVTYLMPCFQSLTSQEKQWSNKVCQFKILLYFVTTTLEIQLQKSKQPNKTFKVRRNIYVSNSYLLLLQYPHILPLCTRCQNSFLCITLAVKPPLGISGRWRNTELTADRLYFSSAPHSNSYQAQTQTCLSTCLILKTHFCHWQFATFL